MHVASRADAPTDPTTYGFREGLEALRRAQKTSKGAPLYSRLVNRPFGRVLAAAANVVGLTPNQVTAISACFTFTAIGLIATLSATPLVSSAVVGLLVVGYAFDAADGQLARLRGMSSPVGEWLDHVVDAAKIASLHLAVLVHWYRFDDERGPVLLLPVAFQIVASTMFFVIILNDHMRRARRGNAHAILQGDGRSSWWYSLAVVPTDYGLLCLVLGLMWWSAGFAVVYGLLLVANIGFLALALPRWFREVAASGRT
jgi:phosphatidylglycerophosphate synthase